MKIDVSKGLALHNLYGHRTLVVEATKAGKDQRFINHICSSVKCKGD